MANWCNAHLIVAGTRYDVLCFGQGSRARTASFFTSDMLVGEAKGLFAERVERLGPNLARKVYKFQVRNDDGLKHFRGVSRRNPALWFVLVYGDPNADSYGSYFIRRGRSRAYSVPGRVNESVMAKHGVTEDSDDEWPFWEASWELMDLAEEHWQSVVLRSISS